MKPDDSLGWCIGTIDFAWPRDVVVCKITNTSFDFRDGVECVRSPHKITVAKHAVQKRYPPSLAKSNCVPGKD